MVGRSKCTAALIERIAARVESGTPPDTAAGCEGVARSTYYSWRDRGERGEEPFRTFVDSVTRARDRFEARMLSEIAEQAEQTPFGDKRDWKARAWVLERTFKERYAKEIRLQAREQAVEDVLDRLRERARPGLYEEVLRFLVEDEGEGEARGAADEGDPLH